MVDTLTQQRDQERDQIRASLKQQRKALNESQLRTAAMALLHHCTPFLNGVKSIAGYQAMSGEIPLDAIFNYCHERNITTLLPIMREQSLLFAPFNPDTQFVTKRYGIQEPQIAESEWLTPDALELVFVPLVAFDDTCNRIGMGGGFYDRSFEFRKVCGAPPQLVGVAHSLQHVENAHAQSWDVPLDAVATDQYVIEPRL